VMTRRADHLRRGAFVFKRPPDDVPGGTCRFTISPAIAARA